MLFSDSSQIDNNSFYDKRQTQINVERLGNKLITVEESSRNENNMTIQDNNSSTNYISSLQELDKDDQIKYLTELVLQLSTQVQ